MAFMASFVWIEPPDGEQRSGMRAGEFSESSAAGQREGQPAEQQQQQQPAQETVQAAQLKAGSADDSTEAGTDSGTDDGSDDAGAAQLAADVSQQQRVAEQRRDTREKLRRLRMEKGEEVSWFVARGSQALGEGPCSAAFPRCLAPPSLPSSWQTTAPLNAGSCQDAA